MKKKTSVNNKQNLLANMTNWHKIFLKDECYFSSLKQIHVF